MDSHLRSCRLVTLFRHATIRSRSRRPQFAACDPHFAACCPDGPACYSPPFITSTRLQPATRFLQHVALMDLGFIPILSSLDISAPLLCADLSVSFSAPSRQALCKLPASSLQSLSNLSATSLLTSL